MTDPLILWRDDHGRQLRLGADGAALYAETFNGPGLPHLRAFLWDQRIDGDYERAVQDALQWLQQRPQRVDALVARAHTVIATLAAIEATP